MFHVGQKVACIEDTVRPEFGRWAHLPIGVKSDKITKGQTYVIREIDCRAADLHGTITVRLVGIFNLSYFSTVGEWEPGFPACYFRPLIERKTNISALQALLNPANHKYLERA